MRFILLYIGLCLSVFMSDRAFCQVDHDPPLAPVLNLVSVQPGTGKTELYWILSSSPDVAGYVIYYFRNNEGFAFDTIYDPTATSYINHGSFSSFLSEAYVIAAIDSSDNISPLSNELHTIFNIAKIDTCKKSISLNWNSYISYPKLLTGYSILLSVNGGTFAEIGQTVPGVNSFILNDFRIDATCCFEINALLEGGFVSHSNRTCLNTIMQRAPQWINADWATVNEESMISLSFTFDRSSEIKIFRLERKTGSEGEFKQIAQVESDNGKVMYIDASADPKLKNSYRLSAINNCGLPVVFSNISGNIVASLQKADNVINLTWNTYKKWMGEISFYKIYLNIGDGFREKTIIQPVDTSFSISFSEIMYDISGGEVCFFISATETANPYGISGESRSAVVCTETTENITVPNAFTPNSDNINDLFRPKMSFTPLEYHLIITDRENNILFENNDHLAEWDGTKGGNPLPQGVYLWFLKVKTPAGKIISRTGTVTTIKDK